MIAAGLRATLVGVAGMMAGAEEPWWIIAGAAAALHGVVGEVGDVDVLTGPRDAARLLGPGAAPGAPSDRYRSALFGRIEDWTLPVEIMAGFELFTNGAWRPVRFAARMPVTVDAATLFVPDRHELAAWLASIGRPKDVARATRLRASIS